MRFFCYVFLISIFFITKVNAELQITFSGVAKQTFKEEMTSATYEMPVGPFYKGSVKTLLVTGKVLKKAWHIKSPNEIKFSDYVNDAKSIINHFKDTKKYKKIIVIGHSEGSLIGILASKSIADGFISIAGAGEDYLTLIQRQLSDRAPYIKSMSDPIIEQLKKNKLVDSVPSLLNNLFGNNVQRFLIDASSYDPAVEISKLDMSVLIIQGTNDIQVEVKDAEILHAASSKSKLEIIQGMNHVFRQASENFILNLQTYANPDLPIDENLPLIIADFIFRK